MAASEEADEKREEQEERELFLGFGRRRMIQASVVVVVLIVATYVLVPKLVGIEGSLDKIKSGDPFWLAVALLFNLVTYFAYAALFRGVVGDELPTVNWRESYQITMASLAASRLFSAGGAGGIVLTYWALRKAGMERRQSICRMVAFLVVLYSVYVLALIVFGVLLRTGVLAGENPVGLTIVPAAISGALILIAALIALIPGDLERRLFGVAQRKTRWARIAQRFATVPATLAMGTRTAINFVWHPSRGGLAMLGAIGFWAGNIAILWACFKAFHVQVPLAVLVQGFFIGMVANLVSITPGGAGSLDAGLIGAYVLFGLPSSTVFVAILTYRLIAFWLPVPPGIVAYFQLRKTVERWERGGTSSPGAPSTPAPEGALLQKVK